MKVAVLDIEANGLYPEVTTVWCMAIGPMDTEEIEFFGPDEIEKGLKRLEDFDLVVGHNLIGYDIPVLEKLYPFTLHHSKMLDTWVLSKLAFPYLSTDDYQWMRRRAKAGNPVENFKYVSKGKIKSAVGSHSLKAWGMRLGILKGDFLSSEEAYMSYSEELGEYNKQDVRVTRALYRRLLEAKVPQSTIDLEMEFQYWIARQERIGWEFNRKKAEEFMMTTSAKKAALVSRIREYFPPTKEEYIPKVNRKDLGYVAGVPVVKYHDFNPGSNTQLAARMISDYGWKPLIFTDPPHNTTPSTKEEDIKYLEFPFIPDILAYRELSKAVARVKGWLAKSGDGKVYGSVDTLGCATRRCSHHLIVNVPRPGEHFGTEQRTLFEKPEDKKDPWILMGCDAKGLELRVLAHFMAKYDGGTYGDIVLSGDPHWCHTLAFGLVPEGTERDEHNPVHNKARGKSKNGTYCLIYGGQNPTLAVTMGVTVAQAKKARENFFKKLPALKKVLDALNKKVLDTDGRMKKGAYINALDGGKIYVFSKHSVLNYLCQSAGALIVKKATNIFNTKMEERFRWGTEWKMVGHFHDEIQVLIRERLMKEVETIALESFLEAGRFFGIRLPIEGDVKFGNNWCETH